jgi:hypothetical protein
MQATETIVSMPILNPETRAPSRTFRYMGKIDGVEDRKIVDWKGVDNPAQFIQRRRIGFQAELYALALAEQDIKLDEIEYRLITRPLLKYSEPKFKWAVMRTGRKSAVKVCDNRKEAEGLASAQGCSVEERVQGDATRDIYENRCFEQFVDEAERMVSHLYRITPSKLEQARWFLWENSKRLLENRRCNRWIPNDKACFAYRRDCEYLELCDAVQNGGDYEYLIEDGYSMLESSHRELEGADANDGLEVLTHSSLGDLTLCEMLYQWRHERKLRKGQYDDGEALWIGSAIHCGLEATANAGEIAGLEAVETWAQANPVLGFDSAWKQDQQVARARAMIRAAVLKWPLGAPDAH